ncbi:hypothetical protein B0H13DRAFT_1853612 [Mycena leptocephala]|nr:hypothetical protein B0H13DRAFT_1853612 [Mycena leptocephala]
MNQAYKLANKRQDKRGVRDPVGLTACGRMWRGRRRQRGSARGKGGTHALREDAARTASSAGLGARQRRDSRAAGGCGADGVVSGLGARQRRDSRSAGGCGADGVVSGARRAAKAGLTSCGRMRRGRRRQRGSARGKGGAHVLREDAARTASSAGLGARQRRGSRAAGGCGADGVVSGARRGAKAGLTFCGRMRRGRRRQRGSARGKGGTHGLREDAARTASSAGLGARQRRGSRAAGGCGANGVVSGARRAAKAGLTICGRMRRGRRRQRGSARGKGGTHGLREDAARTASSAGLGARQRRGSRAAGGCGTDGVVSGARRATKAGLTCCGRMRRGRRRQRGSARGKGGTHGLREDAARTASSAGLGARQRRDSRAAGGCSHADQHYPGGFKPTYILCQHLRQLFPSHAIIHPHTVEILDRYNYI